MDLTKQEARILDQAVRGISRQYTLILSIGTPKKPEAKELAVQQKLALWDAACALLLRNSSVADKTDKPPFAPVLTGSTQDSEKFPKRAIMAEHKQTFAAQRGQHDDL